MKTKICGITNLVDALVAVQSGADMLGFNFYPQSPRSIQPSDCARLCAELEQLAPQVTRVGVFVNVPPEKIVEILENCRLHLAQLSGDEPLTDLARLKGRAFKAVRLSGEPKTGLQTGMDFVPEIFREYADARDGKAPALLIDGAVKGAYGGTGITADWQAAASLARQIPILLAGGLTPDNVAGAVRQVLPWGVDVASGVEISPGKNDAEKVRQFIQNARSAFQTAIQIAPASREDLSEILALQRLAYHSEAELNNDFNIPPLTQTLPELENEYNNKVVLKARVDKNIVGSVRGGLQDSTCHIGRVIVHPNWQNCGIGSRLMEAIEARFADAKRYELFTSERSSRNLYLYQKLGYCIIRQERLDEHVNLVYLEKKA